MDGANLVPRACDPFGSEVGSDQGSDRVGSVSDQWSELAHVPYVVTNKLLVLYKHCRQ